MIKKKKEEEELSSNKKNGECRSTGLDDFVQGGPRGRVFPLALHALLHEIHNLDQQRRNAVPHAEHDRRQDGIWHVANWQMLLVR